MSKKESAFAHYGTDGSDYYTDSKSVVGTYMKAATPMVLEALGEFTKRE